MSDDRLITHSVERDAYSYIVCFVTDAQDSEQSPAEQLRLGKAVMWMCITENLDYKLLLLGSVTNVIESEIQQFRIDSFASFFNLSKFTTKYMLKLIQREIEFYIRQRLKQLASQNSKRPGCE